VCLGRTTAVLLHVSHNTVDTYCWHMERLVCLANTAYIALGRLHCVIRGQGVTVPFGYHAHLCQCMDRACPAGHTIEKYTLVRSMRTELHS
jgi:hypothetical protein